MIDQKEFSRIKEVADKLKDSLPGLQAVAEDLKNINLDSFKPTGSKTVKISGKNVKATLLAGGTLTLVFSDSEGAKTYFDKL